MLIKSSGQYPFLILTAKVLLLWRIIPSQSMIFIIIIILFIIFKMHDICRITLTININLCRFAYSSAQYPNFTKNIIKFILFDNILS